MNNLSKIEWCCLMKNGIRITDKNERVGKEYLESADVDLLEMKKSSLKWKNIQAYYACYNSFYAVLLKVGIKCEIHDCSLELIDFFKELDEEDRKLIKRLKILRTNVQYYLKKPEQIDDKIIAGFVLKCRNIFNSLDFDEIEGIRNKISGIIGKAKEKESNNQKDRGEGDGG